MTTSNQKKRSGKDWQPFAMIIAALVTTIGVIIAARLSKETSSPPPAPTPTPVTVTWGGITWLNKPGLPPPQGYPGYRSRDTKNYESTEWDKAIKLLVTGDEILLIHGQFANISDAPKFGTIGQPNGCFLLITRGPLDATIDLKTAAVEIHQADPEARALTWAAQKVADMQADKTETCGKGVDLWVGK